MFGYFGALFSIFSFTVGSALSYMFARNFSQMMKPSAFNFKIMNNSFFYFIIFRFTPGIPLIIKNFSATFFNLKNTEFIKATFIAEAPQIIIFTFIIQRLIESSELLIEDFDISILYDKLTVPVLLMLILVIFVLILKIKFEKFFPKK